MKCKLFVKEEDDEWLLILGVPYLDMRVRAGIPRHEGKGGGL